MNQVWYGLIITLAFFLEVKAQFVDFEAPFDRVVVQGTLVPVVVANRDSGVLVAQSSAYEVVFSAGLQVYSDAAKTQPVIPGARLSTHTTGYDTLWVTGATDVGNQVYFVSVTGSAKRLHITFTTVPTRNAERIVKKKMSSRPREKTTDILGRNRTRHGSKFQIFNRSRISPT